MIGEVKTFKTFKIIERTVSNDLSLSKPLKQVVPPKLLPFDNAHSNSSNFMSPYARKKMESKSDTKSMRITLPGEVHLNYSQDANANLDGFSAMEVAQLRTEMTESMKPETLAAIRDIQAKKKAQSKVRSREEVLLAEISAICKEEAAVKTVAETAPSAAPAGSEDLSFLPLDPRESLLEGETVELDKLEWMRAVEAKAESAASLSVRFHVDGRVLEPEVGLDADMVAMLGEAAAEDPYKDSLRHHGEEAGRDGYTVSELFWLARSAFPQQRHIAVTALTNVLKRSARLEHAHHFNTPTVTQMLVDSGVVFLARWLLDDAGTREAPLLDALGLLAAVLAPLGDDDDYRLDWPLALEPASLVSAAALDALRDRRSLPPSESTRVADETLVAQDVVHFLVAHAHLVTRLSWLAGVVGEASVPVDRLVLVVLARVAAHSRACSALVLRAPLLASLASRHLAPRAPLAAPLLAVLRALARHGQSPGRQLCAQLPALLPSLLAVLEDGGCGAATTTGALRLAAVLAARDVHTPALTQLAPLALALLPDRAAAAFLSALLTHAVPPGAPSWPVPAHCLRLSTALFLAAPPPALSAAAAASRFYEEAVRPHLATLPALLAATTTHSALAHQRRHAHLHLVPTDLPALLAFAPAVATTTANPTFVDRRPATLALDPSFATLSALCSALQALAASKTVPPPSLAPSLLLAAPALHRCLAALAHAPPLAPVAPHAALVQLQLEAFSQLVLATVALSGWTRAPLASSTATALYQAALALLPCLCTPLAPLGLPRRLLAEVLLSPLVVPLVVSTLPPALLACLEAALPRLAETYLEALVPADHDDHSEQGLDHLLVPAHWALLPLHSAPSPATLVLTMLIDEVLPAPPIAALSRLAHFLAKLDWTTDLLDPSDARSAVAALLTRCLQRPAAIDILARATPGSNVTFYKLYDGLLLQYFSESLSDPLLANVALFPCAMRFPAKFRRHLWSEFLGNMRLVTLELSESLLAVDEYLAPEETDSALLRLYWRGLRDGHVLEDRSALLYWICVHHLNRFVYNRGVAGAAHTETQRGVARVLSESRWQHKPWVQHVRLYKHFLAGEPQLYDALPPSRAAHLLALVAPLPNP